MTASSEGLQAARAYWVTARGRGELRDEAVPTTPAPGRSLVRAEAGAISVGTEKLVGLGLVPQECAHAMACRSMGGSFALPVKYGYSLVGTAVAGALRGQRVFVMHPHQDLAEVADRDAVVLDAAIPSRRATLIPNTETALNAVWDAELAGSERCVVIGAGAVGLLVAWVLHRLHAVPALVVERDAERRRAAAACPWVGAVLAPEELAPASCEVVFHCSGHPAGLELALRALADEGRVLELSWYGTRPVTLVLGTHFHYRRLRIVASQVAQVAPSRRASHGHAGRMAEVLALLRAPEVELLLGAPTPFAALPQRMAELYAGDSRELVPTISYADA